MFIAAATDSFAVKTYVYLRLSIVVVVMSVMASVFIERSRATCWNESISAYFYTPVQSMFVGALLFIGVSLIVIRGATQREDVLLNIAGVFAAIVALVPTARPQPQNFCLSLSSTDVTGAFTVDPASSVAEVQRAIDNNILGLAVAGVAAIGLVLLINMFKNRRMNAPTEQTLHDGIAAIKRRVGAGVWVGTAILVVGLAFYFRYRAGFLERAHGAAAVAMFFVVGVVIAINARSRQRAGKSPWLYACIAGAMAASAVVIVIAKAVADTWNHQILVLEILELTAFAIYWIAQTFEHSDGGISSAVEGVRRANGDGDSDMAS